MLLTLDIPHLPGTGLGYYLGSRLGVRNNLDVLGRMVVGGMAEDDMVEGGRMVSDGDRMGDGRMDDVRMMVGDGKTVFDGGRWVCKVGNVGELVYDVEPVYNVEVGRSMLVVLLEIGVPVPEEVGRLKLVGSLEVEDQLELRLLEELQKEVDRLEEVLWNM